MSKQMYKWDENGQELEDYIESVYRASLKNEYLRNFKIEKNHIEIGRSKVEYKFDVFYEIRIAGITHKVVIECKYYNKRITEEIVGQFKSKLDDCNNIVGYILATKSYNVGAKKFADHYGIKLITNDQLPNLPELLLSFLNFLLPTESVQGDPFWTIMGVTEDGNSTGAFYSFGGNIVNILMPRFLWHDDRIFLFISKKSAERVLKRTGVHGFAVFGITREHLIGICHMAEEYNWPFAIAGTLGFGPSGEFLMFEHSYDEILDHFYLK